MRLASSILSAFPRFSVARGRASSLLIQSPSPSSPRQVPTPALFVSAKGWDPDSYTGVDTLMAGLSAKGFTCIHCDLSLPAPAPRQDATAIMHHFVTSLKFHLQHSDTAFPPVLFARSRAAVIAQSYISSHPASAMILMGDIPATNAEIGLEEFNFEPKFPIALLTTARKMERLRETNRLAQDPQVELLTTEDLASKDAFSKITDWLDELGI